MANIFQHLTKKTQTFGIAGAIGAFIFALLGEPFISLLPKAKSEPEKVDVIFALDATGSMSEEINGVKNGIKDFATKFVDKNISLKVGLVVFRDRFEDPSSVYKLDFSQGVLTDDYSDFSVAVDKVKADKGGDGPESSLDALEMAASMPFREKTKKIIILITDASPKLPDYSGNTIDKLKMLYANKGILQLHLAINDGGKDEYKSIQDMATLKGNVFSLKDIKEGKGFEEAMPVIGETIAKSIDTVIGKGYSEKASVAVFSIFTLWTGLVSLGIALFLIYAQNRYLKKSYPVGQLIKGSAMGLIIGLLAGLFAQLLFVNLPENIAFLSRIFCWGLLGSAMGWSVSKTVPNYPSLRAALGGLIGGLIGGLTFSFFNLLFPEVFARIVGATIIGFFIGIMISILEELFREAWLLVEWNKSDKIQIGLGGKPIILGSSNEADIYLPKDKFPAVTAMIHLDNGKIVFEDKIKKTTTELRSGSTFKVEGINITVQTKK